MSKEALAKVVQRAISDAAFRRQLNSDPSGALRGFDLSADEASALRTGDAGRLSSLGVDQRMSKSFSLGGAIATTRMAASDLTGGGPSLVDDLSGAAGRTVLPTDATRAGGSADASGSEAMRSADIDGGTSGTSTVRAGDDWKFAGRQAPDSAGTVRTGDDWKFADRQSADGASTRAGDDWKFTDKSAGGNMANYPAHDGLAGPSGISSVRAGDDWKFSGSAAAQGGVAPVEGSPEATASEIASGGAARANIIHDDPNGFLAANADAGDAVTRANVIHDDPNGFLAANADAGDAVTRANVIHDDPNGFLAANANADVAGGTAAAGDAFIDESESYLTKVGYDSTAAAGGIDPNVIHDDPDGFLSANADDSGPSSAAPDIGTHHPS
ncbi:MAG: hypothetical protein E6I48_10365 [Chloroflexi bacterium]|nr:MAG: hypothetical protein E6I48_10365 [Chloroflexota bacterium]